MKDRFETFTVLITKINRSIKKIKIGEMQEFDLKSLHVSCLYYLYKSSTMTATELCDICEEDKASISRSLDYLEKNDFIKCDSDAKKRYRSLLELTPKGVNVAKIITEKIDLILDEASSGLSDEERIVLYRSLELISKNLDNICEKYNR